MTKKALRTLLGDKCPHTLLAHNWQAVDAYQGFPLRQRDTLIEAGIITGTKDQEGLISLPIPSLQLTGRNGDWDVWLAVFEDQRTKQTNAHQVAYNTNGSVIILSLPWHKLPKPSGKYAGGVAHLLASTERIESIAGEPVYILNRSGRLRDSKTNSDIFVLSHQGKEIPGFVVEEETINIMSHPIQGCPISLASPFFDSAIRKGCQDHSQSFAGRIPQYTAATALLEDRIKRDRMAQFLPEAPTEISPHHQILLLEAGQIVIHGVELPKAQDGSKRIVTMASTPETSPELPWTDPKFRAYTAYLKELILGRVLTPTGPLHQAPEQQLIETSLDLV